MKTLAIATSSCINLESHDMQIVRKTEQSTGDRWMSLWLLAESHQVLTDVKEIMICKKCGHTIDPWKEES